MEPFKALADLSQSDPRNQLWVVIDQSLPGGTRPITLVDEYSEMAYLELPPSVPDDIGHHFAAVRMLWVYGWFYYPFYTWAGFHAAACAESALHRKLGVKETGTRFGPSFKKLLKIAVGRGLLRDEGFEHARRLRAKRDEAREMYREIAQVTGHPKRLHPHLRRYVDTLVETFPYLRNVQAHPRGYSYTLPGHGRLMIELTRDLITQLFPQEADPKSR